MEDGASGKLNIGFVDASFDPKLSGGDGAELYPFQERAQSNAMTRGVTINQAGGTMVAGGSTSNIGFNTPFVNSGLPGTANYGYAPSFTGYSPGTTFITTEGKVYFAGYNQYGQAGNGTTGNIYEWIESTPASSYPIVAWAQGEGYAVALDSSGQLWATGRNTYGQLGVGDATNRTTWTAVSGTGNQAIACGYEATYRITSTSTLEACGRGLSYRLGTGGTGDQYSFVASTSGSLGSSKVKSVWGNSGGAFVIRADNVLLAVGDNTDGHLGVSPFVNPVTTWSVVSTANYGSETPVQLYSMFDGGSSIHAMMVTAEGNIYGCGDGAFYKTGLNSTTDVTIFTQCTGDIRNVTVTRVACTLNASICLDSTGNVWTTGNQACTGQPNEDNNTEFTKVTLPAEFLSKTIVNVFGGANNSFYAVDSEGTMWGVGNRIRGLGQSQADGYRTKLFSKVPIYDIVPKEFKYTPTLTLENPNPDYGATVEFKNPNNRAFINLDDKTSTLRLGFVDNEDNAGQFRGLEISPTHAPVNYPWVASRSSDWHYNAENGVDVTFVSTYDPYNLWDGTYYTCPVDGVYVTFWQILLTNGNEAGTVTAVIQTQNTTLFNASDALATSDASDYELRNYSAAGYLKAGERIKFRMGGYNGASYAVHPHNGNAYIYLVTRC
jgi:alpha-tubulin suppressor-like RCC1 family protein